MPIQITQLIRRKFEILWNGLDVVFLSRSTFIPSRIVRIVDFEQSKFLHLSKGLSGIMYLFQSIQIQEYAFNIFCPLISKRLGKLEKCIKPH